MSEPMTPERLAEIRHAAQIKGALDIGEHRVELLAEVDRLAVELSVATQAAAVFKRTMRQREADRDAARADALTARKKAVDLLYERDRAREDFRSVQAEWVAARAELAGLRQRVRDLLIRCADGRDEYARKAPAGTAATLATEANALRNAARIAMGDMDTVRALLPSWRWTPDVMGDLPGAAVHMPSQQHNNLTQLFYRLRDSINASQEYELRRAFERTYSDGYADGHLQGYQEGHAAARRDIEARAAEEIDAAEEVAGDGR